MIRHTNGPAIAPTIAPRVTPAMPMSIACQVSAAAARRAGRPRARATARSWRRRRSGDRQLVQHRRGGEDTQEPGEIRRNGADLAQPIDASRREHSLKSVLEQRRPGGLAGGIVGHVGEHVGAQVAVVGRSSGADQGAQRRDRHDEPVGGVVVPPGHDRAGDTQGQGGRSIEGGDGNFVTDSDPEILCCCPAEGDLVRSFGMAPVRHWRASSTEDRLEGLGLDLGAACAGRRHRVVVDHQLSGHRLDAGCGDGPFDGLLDAEHPVRLVDQLGGSPIEARRGGQVSPRPVQGGHRQHGGDPQGDRRDRCQGAGA